MKYQELATDESIEKTSSSLKENNFEPIIVETKESALAKINEIIPQGATVMNGASLTLNQIGYIDLLKSGKHPWVNMHDKILAEKDAAKQKELRKQSVLSEFYLGSVHSLTETGEMVIASNSGSQLPHVVFTSPNIIFVVGSNKITPALADAFKRIEEYVIPLEDERMKKEYGFGTTYAKTVILHKENPMMGRKIKVIIVKEKLGF